MPKNEDEGKNGFLKKTKQLHGAKQKDQNLFKRNKDISVDATSQKVMFHCQDQNREDPYMLNKSKNEIITERKASSGSIKFPSPSSGQKNAKAQTNIFYASNKTKDANNMLSVGTPIFPNTSGVSKKTSVSHKNRH